MVGKGGQVLFAHFDEGTGAHADWAKVLEAATAGSGRGGSGKKQGWW